jgi:hypothetical protein
MPILEFDCSICLKLTGKQKQRFGLKKSGELSANEWFAQCLGCGCMCIKVVDDTKINALDLS